MRRSHGRTEGRVQRGRQSKHGKRRKCGKQVTVSRHVLPRHTRKKKKAHLGDDGMSAVGPNKVGDLAGRGVGERVGAWKGGARQAPRRDAERCGEVAKIRSRAAVRLGWIAANDCRIGDSWQGGSREAHGARIRVSQIHCCCQVSSQPESRRQGQRRDAAWEPARKTQREMRRRPW